MRKINGGTYRALVELDRDTDGGFAAVGGPIAVAAGAAAVAPAVVALMLPDRLPLIGPFTEAEAAGAGAAAEARRSDFRLSGTGAIPKGLVPPPPLGPGRRPASPEPRPPSPSSRSIGFAVFLRAYEQSSQHISFIVRRPVRKEKKFFGEHNRHPTWSTWFGEHDHPHLFDNVTAEGRRTLCVSALLLGLHIFHARSDLAFVCG